MVAVVTHHPPPPPTPPPAPARVTPPPDRKEVKSLAADPFRDVAAAQQRKDWAGVVRLCGDLIGVPMSPAAVCDLQHRTAVALGPIARAAHEHVAGKPANVDETGWREGRRRGWLWVAVTASVTVFLVRLSRARAVLADLIPGNLGVLTTDRYPAYDHLPVGERQVCWAHLRRDFQAMIDRRNAGGAVGEDLLMHAD